MNPFLEPVVAQPEHIRPARIADADAPQAVPQGCDHETPPALSSESAGALRGRSGRMRHSPAQRQNRKAAASRLRHWLLIVALLSGVGGGWADAHALDLNQASATALQALKGVGPKTAERIVLERQRGGVYASLDDLADRVKGIGPARMQRLLEQGLQVSGAASGAEAGSSGQVSAYRTNRAVPANRRGYASRPVIIEPRSD